MDDKQTRTTLLSWLGMRSITEMDFSKARLLGGLLGFLIVVALVLLAIVGFGALIWLAGLITGLATPPPGFDTRGIGFLLAALFGVPFVVWRTNVAQKQADIAADALFNEKINNAIVDLHAQRQETDRSGETPVDVWKDDVIRRNGAIDRLEALAHERPDMTARIGRMLSVYLKELSREFPAQEPPEDAEPDALRDWSGKLTPARSDMEQAAQTLGRLLKVADATPEGLQIDLQGVNLQGFTLTGLDFRQANLGGAQMQGARLIEAQMQGADLGWAQMQGANLSKAWMQGASLIGVQMQGADFNGSQMDATTDLTFANTTRAALKGVNVSQVHISAEQVTSAFGDGSVILPPGIPRPNYWPSEKLDWSDFHKEWHLWQSDPDAYVPPQNR